MLTGHLLCCEHVSVSAAAMVANLDERQGRALLAHATQMRDVMVREQQARQARQQSGTVTQQQQQYQLQGTQQSAAATASVESCAGSAEDLQGQKLSLSGADHDRTTEITSASAPDTNSGSAAPHSVPTCVMGPLGAQPGLGMLAGASSLRLSGLHLAAFSCVDSHLLSLQDWEQAKVVPNCITCITHQRFLCFPSLSPQTPPAQAPSPLQKCTSGTSASHACAWPSASLLPAGKAAGAPAGAGAPVI